MNLVSEVFFRSAAYDKGDPFRIHHFTKVHNFARQIAVAEGMEEHAQLVLELAAILHDIGIRESERIYGDCIGPHQEEIGPGEARTLLAGLPIPAEDMDRICYLIGHHHTYTNIDGLDYQILVEADFLVNLFESECTDEAIVHAYQTIFRTESGKTLCRTLFPAAK